MGEARKKAATGIGFVDAWEAPPTLRRMTDAGAADWPMRLQGFPHVAALRPFSLVSRLEGLLGRLPTTDVLQPGANWPFALDTQDPVGLRLTAWPSDDPMDSWIWRGVAGGKRGSAPPQVVPGRLPLGAPARDGRGPRGVAPSGGGAAARSIGSFPAAGGTGGGPVRDGRPVAPGGDARFSEREILRILTGPGRSDKAGEAVQGPSLGDLRVADLLGPVGDSARLAAGGLARPGAAPLLASIRRVLPRLPGAASVGEAAGVAGGPTPWDAGSPGALGSSAVRAPAPRTVPALIPAGMRPGPTRHWRTDVEAFRRVLVALDPDLREFGTRPGPGAHLAAAQRAGESRGIVMPLARRSVGLAGGAGAGTLIEPAGFTAWGGPWTPARSPTIAAGRVAEGEAASLPSPASAGAEPRLAGSARVLARRPTALGSLTFSVPSSPWVRAMARVGDVGAASAVAASLAEDPRSARSVLSRGASDVSRVLLGLERLRFPGVEGSLGPARGRNEALRLAARVPEVLARWAGPIDSVGRPGPAGQPMALGARARAVATVLQSGAFVPGKARGGLGTERPRGGAWGAVPAGVLALVSKGVATTDIGQDGGSGAEGAGGAFAGAVRGAISAGSTGLLAGTTWPGAAFGATGISGTLDFVRLLAAQAGDVEERLSAVESFPPRASALAGGPSAALMGARSSLEKASWVLHGRRAGRILASGIEGAGDRMGQAASPRASAVVGPSRDAAGTRRLPFLGGLVRPEALPRGFEARESGSLGGPGSGPAGSASARRWDGERSLPSLGALRSIAASSDPVGSVVAGAGSWAGAGPAPGRGPGVRPGVQSGVQSGVSVPPEGARAVPAIGAFSSSREAWPLVATSLGAVSAVARLASRTTEASGEGPQQGAEPGRGSAQDAVDLDRLAEEMTTRILRRMKRDGERRGTYGR